MIMNISILLSVYTLHVVLNMSIPQFPAYPVSRTDYILHSHTHHHFMVTPVLKMHTYKPFIPLFISVGELFGDSNTGHPHPTTGGGCVVYMCEVCVLCRVQIDVL